VAVMEVGKRHLWYSGYCMKVGDYVLLVYTGLFSLKLCHYFKFCDKWCIWACVQHTDENSE